MKKQVKSIGLFLVISLICSTLEAQNTTIDIANERFLMAKEKTSNILANGSPYINPFFTNVSIAKYQNKVYSARFNAFNGELEVKLDDDKLVALDSNGEFEVTFIDDNKKYRSVSYTSKDNILKRGFLVVLSETQNYSLFKKEIIKYYDKVEATSSYQQDKPATFKRENDQFYLKLEDKIFYISKKKKDFLKTFPNKSKKIKTFIKKNKLNLKNENELIQIVDYISTLGIK